MNNLVSLDIETTSDDTRGSVASIAVVRPETQEEFYRLIDLSEGFFGKPAAFVVNGLMMSDFCRPQAVDRGKVDAELFRFIPRDSFAMGRGLSYFDMGFVRKDFPMAAARFQRRLFDLWGFIFGIAEVMGVDPSAICTEAMKYAAKKLKNFRDLPGWGPHHALYDAWENVFVLEYLKGLQK